MEQKGTIGSRLREERQRLGSSQTALAEVGGVTKKTQMLYESGERFADAAYLAAVAVAGADVQYIVTGVQAGQGLGESGVYQAVIDAVELLSLDRKVDAVQLARAVTKLACRSRAEPISTAKSEARVEGSLQVFHKAQRSEIAGRDIVKGGKKP